MPSSEFTLKRALPLKFVNQSLVKPSPSPIMMYTPKRRRQDPPIRFVTKSKEDRRVFFSTLNLPEMLDLFSCADWERSFTCQTSFSWLTAGRVLLCFPPRCLSFMRSLPSCCVSFRASLAAPKISTWDHQHGLVTHTSVLATMVPLMTVCFSVICFTNQISCCAGV